MVTRSTLPPPETAIVGLPQQGYVAKDWHDWFRKLDTLLASFGTQLENADAQLAKAWASVSISGVVTTLASGFNVTSVTFVSTGRYHIILDTSFASANWVPMAICSTFGGAELYSGVRLITTNSVDLVFNDSSGSRTDPVTFYFVGFGN